MKSALLLLVLLLHCAGLMSQMTFLPFTRIEELLFHASDYAKVSRVKSSTVWYDRSGKAFRAENRLLKYGAMGYPIEMQKEESFGNDTIAANYLFSYDLEGCINAVDFHRGSAAGRMHVSFHCNSGALDTIVDSLEGRIQVRTLSNGKIQTLTEFLLDASHTQIEHQLESESYFYDAHARLFKILSKTKTSELVWTADSICMTTLSLGDRHKTIAVMKLGDGHLPESISSWSVSGKKKKLLSITKYEYSPK